MCTHGHPQEEAGSELEVELAVAEPAGAGPAAVVGLDPAVISLFPLLPFMSDGPVGFGGSKFLKQFVHGEDVFHDLCINAWLTSCTECIVCRHEYLGWEPEMLPPDVT
ncbi:hypothetical protein RHGRI_005297 [Rhododendron griersonianum]|uniref:Uncharacterized protein n=1 Tax=Rhododendron griersonianum TaxID=479676 RepID=A0AAV6LCS9_9ERIC|nr:hypothetical protein RHGRI_005297 [Rhododendron griersonianum]